VPKVEVDITASHIVPNAIDSFEINHLWYAICPAQHTIKAPRDILMQLGNALLLKFIAVIFLALAIGTVLRLVALRGVSTDTASARFSSLKSWWALAVLTSLAALMGKFGILLLLATAGLLGLREFLKLIGWKILGTTTVIVLFASVLIYYLLVWFGFGEVVRWTAPLVFLIAIASTRSFAGLIEAYIQTTAGSFMGLMLFVYAPSYAYFVTTLSESQQPAVGAVGWFLYLVVLTEGSDIAQALIGRAIGKTKIIPRTSPNKSLEGLLGGIVVTVGLAVALAPWLTTWTLSTGWTGVFLAILSGLLISIFGFLGGTNMSGIKRDAGVKDGSMLLPGQGGMMDRIDSLTFSAPAFYCFVLVATRYFNYGIE